MKREDRLVEDEGRESNVDFLMPYDLVIAMYRDVMLRCYDPAQVYARFEHQVKATYPNRLKFKLNSHRLNWRDARRAAIITSRVVWHVGVRSDYKRVFWKFALRRLVRGDIECHPAGRDRRPPHDHIHARGDVGTSERGLPFAKRPQRAADGRCRVIQAGPVDGNDMNECWAAACRERTHGAARPFAGMAGGVAFAASA